MKIEVFAGDFSVLKLASARDMPERGELLFSAITPDEISVVCETARAPRFCAAREDGWSAMRVSGTLDFSLIGVLARLTGALADAKISVFCVSTFDTDYILVRTAALERAVKALKDSGCDVTCRQGAGT